jgi:hypothetical protein
MRINIVAAVLTLIGVSIVPAQPTNSPLATGDWLRVEVTETGIYKLDQKFFTDAGIASASVANIRSIRIFGNGGQELPENLNSPRPNGLDEIARCVVDNNQNGVFDATDYVVFYGRSTRGWTYDPSSKSFTHYINHYSEPNYYFITFGGADGRQMDSVASLTGPGAFMPDNFQEKFVLEEERFNLINSGRQWVGRSFDRIDPSAIFFQTLSGYVSTQPAIYKFVLLSRSSTVDTFRVFESDQPLGGPILMSTVDVGPFGIESDYAYKTPVLSFPRLGTLPNDRSTLKISFGTRNDGAKGWLDWFEIHYRRRFEAVGDVLLFSSPDTTANVEYTIRNLSSRNVMVFDVTDHRSVKRITQLVFNTADPSVVTFQLPQTAGTSRDLAVVGPTGFKSPLNPKKIANSNLHGATPGADFVIISPPEFLGEAARLKAHRERQDSLMTMVVNVEQIFNEFSGGLLDPMAIRDFLRYARTYWTRKPAYALLLGAGHFDYKNIGSNARNWILPYETLESINQISSHTSDDYFVMLDVGSSRTSIPIGRLPARTATEAATMVDKVIAYETNVPFDPWRNRITFVGDDGLTSTSDDGSLHTSQSEDLAQFFTPASFEKKKIYLIEYPTVSSATGRRKPDVNAAIVNAVNRGTLIVNYIGHGNPKLWAHEAVFTREGDIAQLTNKDRLAFFVAATCNYAQYDNPLDQSSGEVLLAMEQGGAIGVLTASRAVYSFENSQFNNTFYNYLFQRDSLGRPRRLGDAIWRTKQALFSTNDLKYHLFADPTLRLNMPRMTASVDSVNGVSTNQVVAMKSLGRVVVRGNIKKPDGTAWTTFNGRAIFEAFDSKRRVVVNEWGGFTFEVTGSTLYRGEISVSNGSFQALFPLPKDVSYGGRSRISVYAWNDSTDAVGYTENVTISGSDSLAVPDTTGPRIAVFFEDHSFRSGDLIKPSATLIIDLFDESGINTSVAGIGHRLEARLSGQSAPIDLSDFYRSNLDSYQSGQVRYPLANLPEGRHTLAVKAWDTYNNSSESELTFEVRSASDFALYNVVNYPNPFGGSTVFTFQRNSTEPIDVEVKVYTIAGRLIRVINAYVLTDRFGQIPWDGRDEDGNELANGVYFYKVIAKSQDRQKSVEVMGKLAVLR